MQMIIEARLIDDLGETAPVRLAVIERESTASPIGLSLAEAKKLLASAQVLRCRAVAFHCRCLFVLLTVRRQIGRQGMASTPDPHSLRVG